MTIWDPVWPHLLVQHLATGVAYIWTWIGQPAILTASIVYARATPGVPAKVAAAGCLMHIVGRLLEWFGVSIAPHVTSPQGYEMIEVTALQTVGFFIWEIGNLALAGGVLACALAARRNRQKEHAQHPVGG